MALFVLIQTLHSLHSGQFEFAEKCKKRKWDFRVCKLSKFEKTTGPSARFCAGCVVVTFIFKKKK